MNPLLDLKEHGQSVWLDDIHHHLLTDGSLNRLIEEAGLGGVTSNPTIFKRAIVGGSDMTTPYLCSSQGRLPVTHVASMTAS